MNSIDIYKAALVTMCSVTTTSNARVGFFKAITNWVVADVNTCRKYQCSSLTVVITVNENFKETMVDENMIVTLQDTMLIVDLALAYKYEDIVDVKLLLNGKVTKLSVELRLAMLELLRVVKGSSEIFPMLKFLTNNVDKTQFKVAIVKTYIKATIKDLEIAINNSRLNYLNDLFPTVNDQFTSLNNTFNSVLLTTALTGELVSLDIIKPLQKDATLLKRIYV